MSNLNVVLKGFFQKLLLLFFFLFFYLIERVLMIGANWKLTRRKMDVEIFTGSSRAKCDKVNQYLGRFWWWWKYFMAIQMFLRLHHLTYDPLIWSEVTCLSSTASVLKDGKISFEILLFFFFLQKNKKNFGVGCPPTSTEGSPIRWFFSRFSKLCTTEEPLNVGLGI